MSVLAIDRMYTWAGLLYAGALWLFAFAVFMVWWIWLRVPRDEEGRVATEKSIQRSVVKYARLRNLLAIKLSTLGLRGTAGWPDYLFLCQGARAFFVEFKREGNVLTPLQQQRATLLRAFGFSVYVVDNTPLGKEVIDLWAFRTSHTRTS